LGSGDQRDPPSRRAHDIRDSRYARDSVPHMRVFVSDRGANEGGLGGIDLEHAALIVQENGSLEAKVFDDRLEGRDAGDLAGKCSARLKPMPVGTQG
jgi:hypothetical protein